MKPKAHERLIVAAERVLWLHHDAPHYPKQPDGADAWDELRKAIAEARAGDKPGQV